MIAGADRRVMRSEFPAYPYRSVAFFPDRGWRNELLHKELAAPEVIGNGIGKKSAYPAMLWKKQ